MQIITILLFFRKPNKISREGKTYVSYEKKYSLDEMAVPNGVKYTDVFKISFLTTSNLY